MLYKLFSIAKIIGIGISVLTVTFNCYSQDADDSYTRLNPEMTSSGGISKENDGDKYPYIRYDLNHIIMNGDDWTELASKLSQSRKDGNFTIVHIGDSHIQADGNTGTSRNLFQKEYGNAGRGLIIPYKLAGTNEPLDYVISSPNTFVKSKLMYRPWAVTPGFTGVTLHPNEEPISFTIKTKSPCGYFRILAEGNISVEGIYSDDKKIPFSVEPVEGGADVFLDDNCLEFTVELTGNDVNIFGFDLRNDSPGVVYNAIGNNGATYLSYSQLKDFGKNVSNLNPDLVIISLGSNEAFGHLSDGAFTQQVSSLVRMLKADCPEAKLLLVTPSECQKSTTTSRTTGKGKHKKTVKSRSYQINDNVARVRELIMKFAKANTIPVYDFYAVAGGAGSSDDWLTGGLLSKDRIHRTWKGYALDGTLIYRALNEALTKQSNTYTK